MNLSRHAFDFEIACYNFDLHVTSSLTLPVYKGSTFHGGFGKALDGIGRRFRNYFYNPASPETKHGQRQSLPKPFMLVPPLEEKCEYKPGDLLTCGLILFGEAIQQFMIAFAAMEKLGRDLGLGRDEGRYEIKQVYQLTLSEPVLLFANDHWSFGPKPICTRDIFTHHSMQASKVSFSLVTRLRLQDDNQLVRETPPFSIFFDRLIGRINSLSALYGNGVLMSPSVKRPMLRAAENVRMERSGTTARWKEWTRPSKPGKAAMSFGGLLGNICYSGELGPFVPWLALGQWTGVGGKTSFGLGKYDMEIAS